MTDDSKIVCLISAYAAVALVAFGFICAKLGPSGMIVGLFGGAFWPAAGLIWLGVWLA